MTYRAIELLMSGVLDDELECNLQIAVNNQNDDVLSEIEYELEPMFDMIENKIFHGVYEGENIYSYKGLKKYEL